MCVSSSCRETERLEGADRKAMFTTDQVQLPVTKNKNLQITFRM